MNANRRGELRKQIAQAVEGWLREEAELAGRPTRVLPGDLFLFPLRIEQQPLWAVTHVHPDDPAIWFLVPGDLNPRVGSADIAVPDESLGGPLTLRCGQGLWLTEDVLDLSLRCGVLEDRHVRQAQQTLAELARGTVQATPAQEETDFDPDYEDWLDEVAAAGQALVEWMVAQQQAEPGSRVRRRWLSWSVQWGSEAVAARSAEVEWKPVPFSVGEYAFVLENGRTELGGRTRFGLIQLQGPRFPVPRLFLRLRDKQDTVLLPEEGLTKGFTPGDTIVFSRVSDPRSIIELQGCLAELPGDTDAH